MGVRQGWTIDLPLLCWGPDLTWDGSPWLARVRRSLRVRDPRPLRLNAYRVLLTRDRDGVLLFVPPDPAMNRSFEALVSAGFNPIG